MILKWKISMANMELKPIDYKKEYEKLISDEIIKWFWDNIFKECFRILKDNTIYNEDNALITAIQKGLIYYKGGAFYSKTAHFGSRVSAELEKLGAKYSRFRKAYILDKSKVPVDVLGALEMTKVKLITKVTLIQKFLTQQLEAIKEKKIAFESIVNKIMLNLQSRVYKNAKNKKIELITPKLDDFRRNEIAERYTNNLNFWIKNWTEDEDFNNVTIPKMRDAIGKMVINGKSVKDVENYILSSFTKCKRHAQFLARNETAIATTSYLRAKYLEEGFTEFKWHTNLDGRERPLHRELHHKIFRFDNPPIIDERTGQRGLPAETYNCRCTFSPVATKEFWENRKKLFKANNSLIGKLRKFIKC